MTQDANVEPAHHDDRSHAHTEEVSAEVLASRAEKIYGDGELPADADLAAPDPAPDRG